MEDRTQWKKDEELAEQEKPKTPEELAILADQIRNSIRMMNDSLKVAAEAGLEAVIEWSRERNDKTKVNYLAIQVKKIEKREEF
jgi:hypothetical protein